MSDRESAVDVAFVSDIRRSGEPERTTIQKRSAPVSITSTNPRQGWSRTCSRDQPCRAPGRPPWSRAGDVMEQQVRSQSIVHLEPAQEGLTNLIDLSSISRDSAKGDKIIASVRGIVPAYG